MTPYHPNPALEAELAYRRERLIESGRVTPTRLGAWFRKRRRAR